MAVFCNGCGTGLPHSARFCSNCGAVISAAPAMPGRPLVRPMMGRQIAGVCIGLAQAYGLGCGAGPGFRGDRVLLLRRTGGCGLPGLDGFPGFPPEEYPAGI